MLFAWHKHNYHSFETVIRLEVTVDVVAAAAVVVDEYEWACSHGLNVA